MKHYRKHTKTILAVEDDLISQFALRLLLEKKYKIHVAADALTAKKILAVNKIDLILMDISIKGDQHGLSLTAELKTGKHFSNIPIIVVTAHAFAHDKQRSLNAGADDYLSKPYSTLELLQRIEQHINPERNNRT